MRQCFYMWPIVTFILLLGVALNQTALSRPSVEEKTERRAAYWGLFADVYRARTCLSDTSGGETCATAALVDASTHVAKVDVAVGSVSNALALELASIIALVRARDVAAATSKLTLFRENVFDDFASNTAPLNPVTFWRLRSDDSRS